jgi:hypothetical protein
MVLLTALPAGRRWYYRCPYQGGPGDGTLPADDQHYLASSFTSTITAALAWPLPPAPKINQKNQNPTESTKSNRTAHNGRPV